MNVFTNPNVESWIKWIFRKQDALPAVTVYFLSRKNSTSARFFPLYEFSKNFRIVLIRGLPFPKSDWLVLALYRVFLKMFRKKFERYSWVAVSDFWLMCNVRSNIIINVDDPEYTIQEKNRIRSILQRKEVEGLACRIVVTNKNTQEIFQENFPNSDIQVISQGFHEIIDAKAGKKRAKFSLVYASPYIDHHGDKHAEHDSWSAQHLIDELIPMIWHSCPDVEIHLIGRIGFNARQKLENYPNVHMWGLMSMKQNIEVQKTCHIGIYPRQIDNKRSVMKIFDYAGSGLPIVTYDVLDVSAVKEFGWGICVKSSQEFVQAVELLKSDQELYNKFARRVQETRLEFSWINLARAYDNLVAD